MTQGICELLLLKIPLKELRMEPLEPMRIYCDNKAKNNITQNPIQHDKTKPVKVDQHFIKEKIESG